MCTGLGGAIDKLGRDQERKVIKKDDYEWNELTTSFSDDWSDDFRLGYSSNSLCSVMIVHL
jgi:hypothetical protein